MSLDPSIAPTSILLASSLRPDGTPHLQSHPPKSVPLSATTTALLDELRSILHRLPTENPPSSDIYHRDIGIMWQSDDLTWFNSAPQGCARFDSDVAPTEDDKKAFDRAVEIVDALVKSGVAQEV